MKRLITIARRLKRDLDLDGRNGVPLEKSFASRKSYLGKGNTFQASSSGANAEFRQKLQCTKPPRKDASPHVKKGRDGKKTATHRLARIRISGIANPQQTETEENPLFLQTCHVKPPPRVVKVKVSFSQSQNVRGISALVPKCTSRTNPRSIDSPGKETHGQCTKESNKSPPRNRTCATQQSGRRKVVDPKKRVEKVAANDLRYRKIVCPMSPE